MGKTVYPAKKEEDIRIVRGDEIMIDFGNGLLGDEVWNKLYRAECFSELRFPDGHNYEDVSTTWKTMMRLAKANGTVVVLSEVLFHFRMRKSSISHTPSCSNIIDAWTAYREKYERMSEYRERLLPTCLYQAGKMWMNYCGFSAEEKNAASDIVVEMQRFSKEHFHQFIRGKYPKKLKVICLVSRSSSPVLMWSCFLGHRLLRKIKKRERLYF